MMSWTGCGIRTTVRGAAFALSVGTANMTMAQDDHGDTSGEATLLAIGASVAGSLYNDRDRDFFRLDLVGRALIQVRTSGQTNTQGELLDASGAWLASDDNSGPGSNFDIEIRLQPGVYYVAVTGETGRYAISARLGGDRDHGDTHDASTLLKLHTQEELASVSPSVLLATAGRIYPSTSDTDVFRIDVADDDTEVVLRTSPASFSTYGVLRDATGNEITADNDGDGGFQLSATLNRGSSTRPSQPLKWVRTVFWGRSALRLGRTVPTAPSPTHFRRAERGRRW